MEEPLNAHDQKIKDVLGEDILNMTIKLREHCAKQEEFHNLCHNVNKITRAINNSEFEFSFNLDGNMKINDTTVYLKELSLETKDIEKIIGMSLDDFGRKLLLEGYTKSYDRAKVLEKELKEDNVEI